MTGPIQNTFPDDEDYTENLDAIKRTAMDPLGLSSSGPRRLQSCTWHPAPAVTHYHRPRLPSTAAWTPIVILLMLATFCSVGAAASLPPPPPAPAPAAAATADLKPSISLGSPSLPVETLVVDTRVPVLHDAQWEMVSRDQIELRDLERRAPQDGNQNQGPPSGSTTTTFEIAVSTQARPPATTTTIPASPLPIPLDSNMGSNFTKNANGENSCPLFLNAMLENPTFKQCYPLSMLLEGSRSFFAAQRSLVSITRVLDASCAANVTVCAPFLSALAANLTQLANCGADYGLGNSVVVQTYVALLSYQTVYAATCLRDPDTSSYCFANAVTNLTTTSNAYIFFLPLNHTLPPSAVPACGWCLQNSMAIYQAASANRRQPIAFTYASAATQINMVCGPDFVNESLPAALLLSAASALRDAGGPSVLVAVVSSVLAIAFHLAS